MAARDAVERVPAIAWNRRPSSVECARCREARGFRYQALAVSPSFFADGSAHGLPLEVEAVCIVNDTIENGIGQGWVADGFVPVLDGQLACDDCGGAPMAVFEDFQEVPALRERRRPETSKAEVGLPNLVIIRQFSGGPRDRKLA